jgi:hypothetical protein
MGRFFVKNKKVASCLGAALCHFSPGLPCFGLIIFRFAYIYDKGILE